MQEIPKKSTIHIFTHLYAGVPWLVDEPTRLHFPAIHM